MRVMRNLNSFVKNHGEKTTLIINLLDWRKKKKGNRNESKKLKYFNL